MLGCYKLFVAGSDVGFGANLILDGFWEIEITEFVARNVRQGMVAIDVGANVGYYSLLLADLVGNTGKVVAFEPNPASLALLQNSLSLNGYVERVEIKPYAAWDNCDEQLILKVPRGEPKNSHIVEVAGGTEEFISHIVPSMSLDAANTGPVDFIKIDVEGSEERLWRGMKQLLSISPNVIVLLEFAQRRCKEPIALLEDICCHFPLRYLDKNSTVKPITISEIMQQSEDWTLVLSTNSTLA